MKVDNAAFSAVKDDSTEDFIAKLDSFTVRENRQQLLSQAITIIYFDICS